MKPVPNIEYTSEHTLAVHPTKGIDGYMDAYSLANGHPKVCIVTSGNTQYLNLYVGPNPNRKTDRGVHICLSLDVLREAVAKGLEIEERKQRGEVLLDFLQNEVDNHEGFIWDGASRGAGRHERMMNVRGEDGTVSRFRITIDEQAREQVQP